jgi:hypothetical protein
VVFWSYSDSVIFWSYSDSVVFFHFIVFYSRAAENETLVTCYPISYREWIWITCLDVFPAIIKGDVLVPFFIEIYPNFGYTCRCQIHIFS